LLGTPYLVSTDQASEERFRRVNERSTFIRDQAIAVNESIRRYAEEAMEPFETAVLSDLVAESNRIEGFDWSREQVQNVVVSYRELLAAPVLQLTEALRDDSRVVEVLGLYRAHLLAYEWAMEKRRPREFEIRALHGVITGGQRFAGQYKTFDVRIGGSSHTPTQPWDVSRAMHELANWWNEGTGDPILDATVVHAWLTHIHPFEDGNGRVARLLANLALVQGDYPPLLVRSTTDKGQYYDALAESDQGDILPLWDLFSQILRRTVKTMSRPNFVRDVVQNRLLVGTEQRHKMWMVLAERFAKQLRTQLRRRNWDVQVQGYPDVSAFALLSELDPEGNSWFLKIVSPEKRNEWLLWFGHASRELRETHGKLRGYPSIFFSRRDDDPRSIHPYKTEFMSGTSEVPSELVLLPLEAKPVLLRWNLNSEEESMTSAVGDIADAIAANG
jgi:Fic family protein